MVPRPSITTLAAAFLSLALALPAAATSLKVGSCKRDITPISPSLADEYAARFGAPGAVNHTDPIFMAGFGNNRPATDYHDRLWARGVVVENNGVRVALVQIDLVGYSVGEVETIRAMVGGDVDYVLVGSSHQHEGPDTLGLWGPDDFTTGIDFGYMDFVNATVAACVDDAVASLEKARVFYGEANSAGLSLGLDVEDDGFGVGDGKVLDGDELLAPATQGRIVDPRIGTIQFTRDTLPFQPIATIVNFGSHPESLGSNNTLITSDFPHFVRERLEAEYGGLAIWYSGDLGVLQGPLDLDVQDPLTGMPAQRRTFRWAEVHGVQIAERAIQAIDDSRFQTVQHPVFGPIQVPKPGDKKAEVSFSQVSPVPVRLDNPFFRLFIALGVINPRLQLFTNGVPDPSIDFLPTFLPPPFDVLPLAAGEDLHTEVGLVRIGDAQLLAVPNELDPQIGDQYRAAMEANGADHTFILGLTPDEIGYQVPEAKWDNSCHACFVFVLAGIEALCPPPDGPDPDCNTVFINNVGQAHDPAIGQAVQEAIGNLP